MMKNGQGPAFPRRARDPFGQLPSGVPDVSRWFISGARQSTDPTQRTPHNLLDEFVWASAFRRCRCRVDLLAIAYLSDFGDCRAAGSLDGVAGLSVIFYPGQLKHAAPIKETVRHASVRVDIGVPGHLRVGLGSCPQCLSYRHISYCSTKTEVPGRPPAPIDGNGYWGKPGS